MAHHIPDDSSRWSRERRRYQSAMTKTFLDAQSAICNAFGVPPRKPSRRERIRLWVPRNWWLVLLAIPIGTGTGIAANLLFPDEPPAWTSAPIPDDHERCRQVVSEVERAWMADREEIERLRARVTELGGAVR